MCLNYQVCYLLFIQLSEYIYIYIYTHIIYTVPKNKYIFAIKNMLIEVMQSLSCHVTGNVVQWSQHLWAVRLKLLITGSWPLQAVEWFKSGTNVFSLTCPDTGHSWGHPHLAYSDTAQCPSTSCQPHTDHCIDMDDSLYLKGGSTRVNGLFWGKGAIFLPIWWRLVTSAPKTVVAICSSESFHMYVLISLPPTNVNSQIRQRLELYLTRFNKIAT